MSRLWLLSGGVAAALVAGGLFWCFRPGVTHPADGDTAPPWFEEITAEVGLDFVHDPGPLSGGEYPFPRIMGSGAAWLDFDGDGLLDLYLVQNGGPNSRSTNRLFRQGPPGRFTDVSKGSGLDIVGQGMGVAIGDVNNDGRPDVLVTEYGRTRLFLNNGNGTFTDVTKAAGIDNPRWGVSASFIDFDRDGWLDLVVVNYIDYDPTKPCLDPGGRRDYCGPKSFLGTVTKLYRNLGASGQRVRFEDVTVSSGLGRLSGPGLGVICADFTGDRWPDILIANDGHPNHLWVNQHNGTFKEEAVSRGLALNGMGAAEANMGVAIGDVEGRGLFDVFVTHLVEEKPTLWRQGPRGTFQDHTAAAGLASPRWRGTGFGTVLADFDLDGLLDLAVVNGGVKRGPAATTLAPDLNPFWKPYAQRNQLFLNVGKGRFRDISEENHDFSGNAAVSRGLACADFDNDGAMDLLVTAVGSRARLYRNVAPRRGHWLGVRCLLPKQGGRDAYGAEVTVRAGDRRWLRGINPGYSYLCSNDPRAHFGLGSATRVDGIEVVWPDGSEEHFPGGDADRYITLRQGEGRSLEKGKEDQENPRHRSPGTGVPKK